MATGATEFVDNTTADAFIPEIWSLEAIVAREQRLVYSMLVNRVFEKDLKVGDTVHVPSVGNLAARTKTRSSNAAITFETLTETNTDITVTTWEYAAMAVESIIKVQANRDMFRLYAGKMGYALDLSLDAVLAGLPDDFSQYVGSLASDLLYDDLLAARQYLDDANAPEENRVMIISPKQEAGLLKIDNFISREYADATKVSTGASGDKGWIGSWMGMPIFKSTHVEGSNSIGHDNTMFQKEALALVHQMKPTAHSMYDINYLCDKVVLEQVYGAAEMRDDHGVWMKGS